MFSFNNLNEAKSWWVFWTWKKKKKPPDFEICLGKSYPLDSLRAAPRDPGVYNSAKAIWPSRPRRPCVSSRIEMRERDSKGSWHISGSCLIGLCLRWSEMTLFEALLNYLCLVVFFGFFLNRWTSLVFLNTFFEQISIKAPKKNVLKRMTDCFATTPVDPSEKTPQLL